MNNNHLINIAIHHIKEENEAHGIGELKRGLYRDLEGIHLDVNTIKTDIITVGSGITNLSDSLGDLAWDDKVEKAKLGTTIIEGGYLLTSLIKTDDLIVGDNIMMGPNAIIDWEHLTPEIIEEFDIGKMKWLGSLEDFPMDPGVNHAFYHSINMCSYIWSGSEWYKIAQDGTAGPKGDKGDKGDKGTDGSYYAPSYLHSTFIGSTEIYSPIITGNTCRFADSVYIGQNDGSNNKVGMSAIGDLDTSVRIWAGDTNKLTAPFRVTQGGSVTMTDANITGKFRTKNSLGNLTSELVDDAANSGGTLFINDSRGYPSVAISDATGGSSGSNTGGIIHVYNHSLSSRRISMGVVTSTDTGIILLRNSTETINVSLDAGNVSYFKNKVAIGGTTVPSNYASQITGNLNIVGDLYINGVKFN